MELNFATRTPQRVHGQKRLKTRPYTLNLSEFSYFSDCVGLHASNCPETKYLNRFFFRFCICNCSVLACLYVTDSVSLFYSVDFNKLEWIPTYRFYSQ